MSLLGNDHWKSVEGLETSFFVLYAQQRQDLKQNYNVKKL